MTVQCSSVKVRRSSDRVQRSSDRVQRSSDRVQRSSDGSALALLYGRPQFESRLLGGPPTEQAAVKKWRWASTNVMDE
jgi:hypothetical protein